MKDNFNTEITTVLEDNPLVTRYHFNLETGNGNMNIYHLFDGIDLIFNDFNCDECNQLVSSINYRDYLIINHCNKGRFETVYKKNYIYLSEGDIVFSSGAKDYMHDFPLGYYNGLQILINLKTAQKSIDKIIGSNIVDIRKLSNELISNDSFAVMRSTIEIEHVISELYHVEENIKRSYYKLKVLELLLFISNSDINSIADKFPTLKVENVNKIKEIRNYLICNLDENITLDDLSLKYNVSKTTIKTYFKTIYGKALMTWRREYRLNRASILLKNKDLTVADISQQVGYMDESKFIKAFKKYHGSTPNKYRRKQNN